MKRPPIVLLVLDGWGHRAETEANAVAQGAPYFASLMGEHPHTLLTACGREVGLPRGVMGNSEVGHTNLGAGRVVYQDVTRIDKAIEDGEFAKNPAFLDLIQHVRQNGKRLHLVGLLSTGMVHASDHHLRTLLELAAAKGLKGDDVAIHAITDGRDTGPRSAAGFLETLEDACERHGVGRIATLVGRYFAMDRDKRWERVKKSWDVMVHGAGEVRDSAVAAMKASYESGVGDEFLEPVVIRGQEGLRIEDGDAVLLFNYRADRMRQMTDVFVQDGFDGFDRGDRPSIKIASMTQYRDDFSFPVAFPSTDLVGIFPELISSIGMRQERIAETEKYAHVTYFFSGGREDPYEGESRTLVPSQKVATYDLAPEMSAEGITKAILASLEKGETEVYVVNFANADMVGHTGIFDAVLKAVQKVDECLQRVVAAVKARGGTIAVTADHGNSEQLWDFETNQPHTAHTLNPVPFVLIGPDTKGVKMRERGALCDVAPTLLGLMGVEKDPSMDGVSLILP
ncbi:2,3-bisphosphoglycerate-independent phosphoglycerate mutase [Planctomycetes bacterium Poly30]|uniref:2,3-bisphosphoglycerate-independent phosphoglycerate mutase n=1 Tax=Saltatorellus ferox TaxID=2528018 RepID=A0A518EXL9_9BACT|nr:2,3-bisphosphoglycerate-independent phosphoglycerate mutase [Planctomycetes bacterium Poly30]